MLSTQKYNARSVIFQAYGQSAFLGVTCSRVPEGK